MTGGWRAASAVLALYATLVVVLVFSVDRTADESTYLLAGRAIVDEGWVHPFTRLHGPLPFLANQLFVGEFVVDPLPLEAINRGRLGLVPFGVLSGVLVFLCARRLFGVRGALLSLALFAFNPLMLGYGALLAVDMAYTAGVLLALLLAARFVERPNLARGVAAGAGLGIACATKYLALFCVPLVLVAVAFGVARSGAVGPGRWARSLGASAGAALVALVTLHACYGFSVGRAPSDPQAYASAQISRVLETPVLGSVVTLLPEPYLVGADFQMSVGGGKHRPYLEGEIGPGHGDYYLWVFLRKTPEWVLLLFGGVALAWLARGGRPRTSAGAVALGLGVPTALMLLVYLSFFTRLQLGVRYVLPLYPLAFIACGAAAEPLVRRRGAAWALGVLALTSTVWDLATQWPNLTAYYNVNAGGQRDGWKHFCDSNSGWGQLIHRGRDVLTEREGEGWTWLRRDMGPRLGRFAIYITDMGHADPENPDVARHWAHAFEPVDNVGASWWVFDISSADWAARIDSLEPGPEADRERSEFALALCGAGDFAQARDIATTLPGERGKPLLELLDLAERAPSLKTEEVFDLTQRWRALGRGDMAAELLRTHPAVVDDARQPYRLATALAAEFRTEEAIDLLVSADLTGRTGEVLLLSSLYRQVLDLDGALACLERWAPTLPQEVAPLVDKARVRLSSERDAQQAFRDLVSR